MEKRGEAAGIISRQKSTSQATELKQRTITTELNSCFVLQQNNNFKYILHKTNSLVFHHLL